VVTLLEAFDGGDVFQHQADVVAVNWSQRQTLIGEAKWEADDFDLGQWRSQGIDPKRLSAIGVKAAVAHRRAYEKIQRASYTVSTPGPCSSDVKSFPYQHVRRPVYPLDK